MTDTRILLYRLLAQTLVYPEAGFIPRLQQTVGKMDLEMLDNKAISFAPFIQELNALSSLPLDQVQGEFTRLFISAFPRVPCPPYESAYREGVLLGESAEEVNRYYRRWGLSVEGEEVDHIGVELEFLAFLGSLADPEAREAAERFMQEHVLAWVSCFASDLTRESRLGFYQEVGKLMTNILRMCDGYQ